MKNIYVLEIIVAVILFVFTISSLSSTKNLYSKASQKSFENKQILEEYQKELITGFDDFSFSKYKSLNSEFLSISLFSKK